MIALNRAKKRALMKKYDVNDQASAARMLGDILKPDAHIITGKDESVPLKTATPEQKHVFARALLLAVRHPWRRG
jgi:hypothetical protein